jgi:hypothetical protein
MPPVHPATASGTGPPKAVPLPLMLGCAHAADTLADKQAELAEAATATAQQLSQPQNAALLGASSVAALVTLLRPHETFQFVGLVGLELSLLNWALKYESPQDAVEDVERTFTSIIDAVSTGTVQLRRDGGAPVAEDGGAVADVAGTSEVPDKAEAAPEVPPVVIDEQEVPQPKTNGNGKKLAGRGPESEAAGLSGTGSRQS